VRLRGLYPILDVATLGVPGVHAAAAVLSAGRPALLQLRAKAVDDDALVALARGLLARGLPAPLVINDRADVARLVGAAGVHLGQDDLSPEDARRLLPRPALVGVSTHDLDQLDRALDADVDYVAFGPVRATPSKARHEAPVGLEQLAEAARRARRRRMPLVAIGGLTHADLPSVYALGVDLVALIGALFRDPDPAAIAQALAAAAAARPADAEPPRAEADDADAPRGAR
jgi:thiamine-phosphate pyrophosphorylase